MFKESLIYELELTTDQLEIILGVSHMTLFRWRKKGLPSVKKGNNIRFKLAAVEKWLKQENIKISFTNLKGV